MTQDPIGADCYDYNVLNNNNNNNMVVRTGAFVNHFVSSSRSAC